MLPTGNPGFSPPPALLGGVLVDRAGDRVCDESRYGAALGDAVAAVAVCADCGAGVCPGHARVAPRWLTRTLPINRTVAVEPPARAIRCGVCQAARDAAPAASSAATD